MPKQWQPAKKHRTDTHRDDTKKCAATNHCCLLLTLTKSPTATSQRSLIAHCPVALSSTTACEAFAKASALCRLASWRNTRGEAGGERGREVDEEKGVGVGGAFRWYHSFVVRRLFFESNLFVGKQASRQKQQARAGNLTESELRTTFDTLKPGIL